jgi:hypothetical protein
MTGCNGGRRRWRGPDLRKEGETLNEQGHWDKVYSTKAPDAVSWYRAHLSELQA